MKTFADYLKKLPHKRRARIEEIARRKITAIRLQQAREQLGVSQQELAARLHMTQPSLSRFERRPNVTVNSLQRYVEALGGKLEVSVVMPKKRLKHPAQPSRGGPPRRIAIVTA
jgi:transcriptional regulator with XRE-family HTH domain